MQCRLWSFGANHHGQLGIGLKPDDLACFPQLVGLPPEALPLSVACGQSYSALCTFSGQLYVCGSRTDGNDFIEDQCVSGFYPIGLSSTRKIVTVVAGDGFIVALTSDGELVFLRSTSQDPFGVINLGVKRKAIQLSAGHNHALVLTSSGELFSWGSNDRGQLGISDDKMAKFPSPQPIDSLTGLPIRHIAAGGFHSLVLSVSGALFSFGSNSEGQLGLGDCDDKAFPRLVKPVRQFMHVTYVCAGESHSAILTTEGGVLTFGCGRFGQLGHGPSKLPFENSPRRVLELLGSKVEQIACGRRHTIAFVPSSGKVYVFGQGIFGQLGLGPESFVNAFYPTELKCWQDSLGSSERIAAIFAGPIGDNSFILTYLMNKTMALKTRDYTLLDILPKILCLSKLEIQAMLESRSEETSATLDSIFASQNCLNASFLTPGLDHYRCSSSNSGVNLLEARQSWHTLLTNNKLANSTVDRIFSIISNSLLPFLRAAPPDVEALRLYLVLMTCPRFDNPDSFMTLQCPFAYAVTLLDKNASKVLLQWWARMVLDDYVRLVTIYKRCITHVMSLMHSSSSSNEPLSIGLHGNNQFSSIGQDSSPLQRSKAIQVSLEMLKLLNMANEEYRPVNDRLPYDAFYISEIREFVDVPRAYLAWVQNQHRPDRSVIFSLCNYPFIFDGQSKTLLLQTDSQMQRQFAFQEAHMRAITNLFTPGLTEPVVPILMLMVRRQHLVEDTIGQLARVRSSDFKKPLQIQFHNEEAEDAGGVKKEFFMLLFRQGLIYGMFKYYEESRLLWFSDETIDGGSGDEDLTMFRLIGTLIGLTVFNSVIVDISFPLALYRKLLKRPCILDDLKELMPTVGRSIQSMLDFDDPSASFEDTFCLNFEISRERFGRVETVELVPGGSSKQVTLQNRQEYAKAYVDFIFEKSVQDRFRAFYRGFEQVCEGVVLDLFHPSELQAMVVGNESYDWMEFEKNCEYKEGYHAKHPTIRMFWEVFHSLSTPEKRKFLLFLTGSDRVPILGMKAVKIIIRASKGGEQYLPVAHTCFNLLDLPIYSNSNILREKLLMAIEHKQGFTLV